MYRADRRAYVVRMHPEGSNRRHLDAGGVRSRFGENLAARRREAGLTQEKLAARSGVHVTYISEAERGLRNVSLVNIAKLAAGLEISAGELMDGLPPSGPPGR